MQIFLIYFAIKSLIVLCDSMKEDIAHTTEQLLENRFLKGTYHDPYNQMQTWTPVPTSVPVLEKNCPLSSCLSNDVTVDTNTRSSFSRGCFCDKNCADLRDCCEDSILYDKEEQQKPSSFHCEYVMGYYYVKSGCPSGWDDRELAEKCGRSKNRDLNTADIQSKVPVTSLSTYITYGNVFCGICNGEEDLVIWNVTINDFCIRSESRKFQDATKSVENLAQLGDASELKFDGAVWYFTKNRTKYVCELTLNTPTNLPLHSCQKDKTIDSCVKNWTDVVVLDRCNGAYAKVYDYFGHTYKNRYCAYCNGLNDTQLTCYPVTLTRAIKFGFDEIRISLDGHRSFSVLFDFKFEMPVSKLCRENSTREKNQILTTQKCLRPSTNLTEAQQQPSSAKRNANDNWFFTGYTSIAVLASLIFLIVHLTVFFVVKELHTIGGRNLASFCFALVLAYSSFLLGNYLSGDSCFTIAVITYYSFLSAFSWMLTISFDMWQTFWKATRKFACPRNSPVKFRLYSVWSWTLPAIAASAAVYLDLTKNHSHLAPHFGENGCCWFRNGYALLVFFVAPVSVVISINFALFLHTSVLLHSSRCESVNQTSRVDFKLYARIALLTGFTWITGFVAGYFQNLIFWFEFIFLNTAQGAFIFSAFTCKKKIILSFLKRTGAFQNWQTSLETNNTINFTALSSSTSKGRSAM